MSVVAPVAGATLPTVLPAPATRPAAPVQPVIASDTAPAVPATLEITYRFDKELNQIIFTLRRPDTGQVVRQVPPNAILAFAAYILRQAAQAMDARA